MFGRNEIYKIDYLLVVTATILVFIGILMIYSSGFDPIDKVNSGLYKKQLIWFIIGFILMIAVSFVNHKMLGEYSLHIYIFVLILLILTQIMMN